MTLSINNQQSSGHAHWHRKTENSTSPTAASATGGSAASSPTAANATGLQGFATELQSILVSLQSNPATGTPGSPSDSSTASATVPAGTDAASASATALPGAGGSPVGGPLTGIAERLQQLLQGTAGAAGGNPAPATASSETTATAAAGAPAAGSDTGTTLQSVLDKLQATLSQALQSYSTTASNASATNLLS